jgi:hypothetical protein
VIVISSIRLIQILYLAWLGSHVGQYSVIERVRHGAYAARIGKAVMCNLNFIVCTETLACTYYPSPRSLCAVDMSDWKAQLVVYLCKFACQVPESVNPFAYCDVIEKRFLPKQMPTEARLSRAIDVATIISV